jgi:hypothetical protein
MVAGDILETSHGKMRFLGRIVPKEISMRPAIAVVLACLALAACGSTERKTVIVNPPPNSTTTVDSNGNAHVTPN